MTSVGGNSVDLIDVPYQNDVAAGDCFCSTSALLCKNNGTLSKNIVCCVLNSLDCYQLAWTLLAAKKSCFKSKPLMKICRFDDNKFQRGCIQLFRSAGQIVDIINRRYNDIWSFLKSAWVIKNCIQIVNTFQYFYISSSFTFTWRHGILLYQKCLVI